MIVEEIQEPIEVIARFKRGKIKPLRLKWQEQIYAITRVEGEWSYGAHGARNICFSLTVEGERLLEIHWDERSLEWILDKVYLEG